MSGWAVRFLSLESTFGSLHHICIHPNLCRMQSDKKMNNVNNVPMCRCDNVTIGCAMIRKAMGRTMIRKAISTLTHWHIGTLFIIGILFTDRKSTRLNSSHSGQSRMPSSA